MSFMIYTHNLKKIHDKYTGLGFRSNFRQLNLNFIYLTVIWKIFARYMSLMRINFQYENFYSGGKFKPFDCLKLIYSTHELVFLSI